MVIADNIGIPSGAVDSIFDFIDEIVAMLVTLIEALIEMVWDLVVNVFTDLAPAFGFALILCFWLYVFYAKYIEGVPR